MSIYKKIAHYLNIIFKKNNNYLMMNFLYFRYLGSSGLTSKQFHVLFNSLFRVLFNFPSRYLFAIGLMVIFSFRWSLPPNQCCTIKQHDSQEISSNNHQCHTGLSPSMGKWPHLRRTQTTNLSCQNIDIPYTTSNIYH